jgi:hypothetical protein
VGKSKFVITAGIMEGEEPKGSGTVEVTPRSITGHYTCPGATTYDVASRHRRWFYGEVISGLLTPGAEALYWRIPQMLRNPA